MQKRTIETPKLSQFTLHFPMFLSVDSALLGSGFKVCGLGFGSVGCKV